MLTYQTTDSPFMESITIDSTKKDGNSSLILKTKKGSDASENFKVLLQTKGFFGIISDHTDIKELDIQVIAMDIDNCTITVEAKNFEPIFRKMATISVVTGPGTPLITNELCETLINALPAKKKPFENNEELGENAAPEMGQSPRTSPLTTNPSSFHHHKPKGTNSSNKCSPQSSPESLSPSTLIKSY